VQYDQQCTSRITRAGCNRRSIWQLTIKLGEGGEDDSPDVEVEAHTYGITGHQDVMPGHMGRHITTLYHTDVASCDAKLETMRGASLRSWYALTSM
jgi:hypothetical protein